MSRNVSVHHWSKMFKLWVFQKANDGYKDVKYLPRMRSRITILSRKHCKESVQNILQKFDNLLSILQRNVAYKLYLKIQMLTSLVKINNSIVNV